jgi:hypothetical protein
MLRSAWLVVGSVALACGGCAGRTFAGTTDGGAGHGGAAGTGGNGGVPSTGGSAGVPSTGGSAGVPSTGGSGGVVSSGGTSSTCNGASPPSPACGAALCGNGTIDSCNDCPDGGWGGDFGEGPRGPGGPPCVSGVEDCDGAQLGGASCTSLGFAGGTLHCLSSCHYDTSGCERCASAGGHVAACTDSIAGAKAPSALAVAATADEIGLAWISTTAGGPELWFARLTPDLSLITKTGPIAANCPGSIALATRPGGWELATSAYEQGVQLFAIDAAGTVTGRKQITPSGHGATFGERPGATPLLAWIDDKGSFLGTEIVSADGLSATPPVQIPMPGGVVDSFVSSVYVGGGFLVATRSYNRIVVARVETDGSTTGTLTDPTPDEAEFPALASAGNEARLVYGHFAGSPVTVELVRLDAQGKALASPIVVGSAPAYYDIAYPVAAGTDTLVVLGNYTGGVDLAQHLDVVRVDQAGNKLWGPRTIATDPTMLADYNAVMSGSVLVSAFIEGGTTEPSGVGAARIVP